MKLNVVVMKIPSIYDPFSGGGSIPLEAQRIGLKSFGSDLNPVAVIIGKSMIEMPVQFKNMFPVHLVSKKKLIIEIQMGYLKI